MSEEFQARKAVAAAKTVAPPVMKMEPLAALVPQRPGLRGWLRRLFG